jgi:hypothetical protein
MKATKTNIDTHNLSWVNEVKEAYSTGCSDVEVCKILKITQKKFDELYSDPDNTGFKQLVDMGRTMSKAYWYELARKNLWERSFNSTMWAFVMKNRFGWAEKSENLDKTDIPTDQLSLEELQQRLKKALPAVMKQLSPDLKDTDLLGLPVTH